MDAEIELIDLEGGEGKQDDEQNPEAGAYAAVVVGHDLHLDGVGMGGSDGVVDLNEFIAVERLELLDGHKHGVPGAPSVPEDGVVLEDEHGVVANLDTDRVAGLSDGLDGLTARYGDTEPEYGYEAYDLNQAVYDSVSFHTNLAFSHPRCRRG